MIALLIAALAVISGCAWVARRMAEGIADTTFEKEVSIPVGSVGNFWNCFKQKGGSCPGANPQDTSPVTVSTIMPSALRSAMPERAVPGPNPADLAISVLESKAHQEIVDLYNDLMSGGPQAARGAPSKQFEIDLTWKEFSTYLDDLDLLAQSGGFELLHSDVQAAIAGQRELASSGEVNAYSTYVTFVKEYFHAYFRNGKFFKATVDTSGLEDKIKEELKSRLRLEEGGGLDQLVKELLEEFKGGVGLSGGNEFVFGDIGTVGFVTRAGAKYQFPALEAKIDPTAENPLSVTKLEPVGIGNDALRVLIEASMDAWHQLPCVSTATGTFKLKVNDPDEATSPASEFLSAEHFESVETWANRAEGGSSALVGRLVRGGGWIALNNEALAQLLETFVGVTVRKFTEKTAWCVYSCNAGLGISRAAAYGSTRPVKLVVRVSGLSPI
jgi:hypothetical protein